MELQCKIEIRPAAGEKVFSYWTEEAKRKAWEDDLESLVHDSHDGEIVAGTTGRLKLAGKPEMAFTVIEAIPGESYRERYELPFGVLILSHRLVRENGKTCLFHAVELEKPALADGDLAFLSGVFADFPVTANRLKCLLEN
ncbi:MAG: hypothetical protein LBB51_06865 [Zoogloeaceae bacterium]|jgi:uncharacterized protein YndB with AHSA1/START domain|nr:hypothetical protein [Zoogloeaceae bacterium]